MTKFLQHEIEWTREKSSRFWDYFSGNSAYAETYFSKQFGDALIRFVKKHIPLKGAILDFGCGPGFLMDKMIHKKIACEGVDFSAEAIDTVNRNYDGSEYFKGAQVINHIPTQIEDNTYDVVFLIETIEHLLADDLSATLKEIFRITKNGGHIVITAPNNENLAANKVMCPECGCVFHRVQHIRSVNSHSLPELLKSMGFSKVICKGTFLRRNLKLRMLNDFLSKIRKEPSPHLVYIGRK